VRNSGRAQWPVGTQLRLIQGQVELLHATLASRHSLVVERAEAAETVEVTCELKAPEEAGRYRNFWRLADGDEMFGDRLWLE
jgi:hypothetical protein